MCGHYLNSWYKTKHHETVTIYSKVKHLRNLAELRKLHCTGGKWLIVTVALLK